MRLPKVLFRFLTLIFLFFIPAFTGCNSARGDLDRFNEYVLGGNYENGGAFAESNIKACVGKPGCDDLLWTLQSASMERMQKRYEKSNSFFDSAESMMKYHDLRNTSADILVAAALNDNAVAYGGSSYDSIMVNVYKGLNFMKLGQWGLARVEFNRALERQRRAREEFSEEIGKLEDKIRKGKNEQSGWAKSFENPELQKIIRNNYSNFEQFKLYPDFVNPFATYMAGVFESSQGQYSKALDLMKETCGMVPENSYAAREFNLLSEIFGCSSAKAARLGRIWVIFENGLCPIKKEIRLDLPLFVASEKVYYFGIALPKLEKRGKAARSLTVLAGGENYVTETLADMDSVIRTEFDKRFKFILAREIISASAKAAAQYAIQKNENSTLAALMAVYSFATTSADVRIWSALPSDFQVASFAVPKDGRVEIFRSGNSAYVSDRSEGRICVDVSGCENAIVYVRIVSPGSRAVVDVIKM